MYLDLCDSDAVQTSLFDELPASKRNDSLMDALDDINDRFGKGKLRPASEGFAKKWEMKSNIKTPAYTTRIDEVIHVR